MAEQTERFVCTVETPWNSSMGDVQTWHPSAKDIGECSDGCCDYYECPVCGLYFKVEVGQ